MRLRKKAGKDSGGADRRGSESSPGKGDTDRSGRGRAGSARQKPVKRIGNRWAAPAMIACALIGLVWIVVFYVFQGVDVDVPVITDLGNWNLVVGMGFIVAAFGFSMKWE